MMSGNGEHLVRVVVFGQDKVGKTALVLRLEGKGFPVGYTSTIGMDFKVKRFSLDPDQVKFQIWDTAGQDRFQTMTSAYIRGSHTVIVMYNNDAGSLEKAQKWIGKVKEDGSTKKILLVHNPFSHGEALETEAQRSAGADIAERDENITFRQINVKTMRSDDITALLTDMWGLVKPSLLASSSVTNGAAGIWRHSSRDELEEGKCQLSCAVS